MFGLRTDWLLRLLLPLMLIGLIFSIGCDELLDDDDEEESEYTSPPSEMLGDWYLFAGNEYGDVEMYVLEQLNIFVEIYSSNGSTKFRMSLDGEVDGGDVDWREERGVEYLTFIEDGDETKLEVIERSGTIIRLIVPNDEGPDQQWIMAKGNYMFAGIVVDASDNVPLDDATITITDQNDAEVAVANTGPYGVYVATGLEAGDLTVTVTSDGFRTQTVTGEIEYDSPVFMSFAMVEGSSTMNGTVAGLVSDASTLDAIAGVTISALGTDYSTTTDNTGAYTLIMPEGSYTIVAEMNGYTTQTADVTITSSRPTIQNFSLATGSSGFGTVSGHVTASQSGESLEGVAVSVGGTEITTVTDSNGDYTLSDVPAGLQEITAEIEGYYSLTNDVVLTADGLATSNFSLSPVISSGTGKMRMVLTWGEAPSDLDSHLMTPEIDGDTYHVYFGSRGDSLSAPYARLDVDDTSGFGPETITIYDMMDGTYQYYIYNWSGTPDIAGCGAQVQMYDETGLIQTLTVPATGEGRYWYICDINGTTGGVSVVNEIRTDQPSFVPGAPALKMR